MDLTNFPPEKTRNFSIIAHIDHGKTTLSTKLLESTGTLSTEDDLYLDKLSVEKERGITVKAQTATMLYDYDGQKFLLNLIDTPGHVDFSYEVSRSLRACEGAVLLVDCIKGVQAQTMANYYQANDLKLQIVPVLNKVDMKNALIPQTLKQLETILHINPNHVIHISGKTGLNVDILLETIVERVPPPEDNRNKPFRSLLFDSWYGNEWSGVVCLVKVADGTVKIGDEIQCAHSMKKYVVSDVGIMYPEQSSTGELHSGQVGYICCGMKSTKEARVGDTIHTTAVPIEPFPGFKEPKPMVFGGIYPSTMDEFQSLSDAIEKLALTDPSVHLTKDTNDVLGFGFRCGFLGLLHMDVFSQRLRQEYGANVISTSPTVPYLVKLRSDGKIITVNNPSDWPEENLASAEEPVISATIITPKQYMGDVIKLCQEKRGEQKSLQFIDEQRVILKYIIPLAEVLTQFYDKLKSCTQGYATFDYEAAGYQPADLVKVTMLLNGKSVGPLSLITHKLKAYDQGRLLCTKLKDCLRRQQFEVAVQAAIGKKVIARETIKALRKDVTAKCYGGDVTRKLKLLERQKEGKKRMKQIGNVNVPQEAFLTLMKV